MVQNQTSLVFEGNGVKIIERQGRFFIRYDAGAHQVEIREDEISSQEVLLIQRDGDQAVTQILVDLQDRLLKASINPYVSNLSIGERRCL